MPAIHQTKAEIARERDMLRDQCGALIEVLHELVRAYGHLQIETGRYAPRGDNLTQRCCETIGAAKYHIGQTGGGQAGR